MLETIKMSIKKWAVASFLNNVTYKLFAYKSYIYWALWYPVMQKCKQTNAIT